MALIKCTKCGNMISDKAIKCPKCGCLSTYKEQVGNSSTQDKKNYLAQDKPNHYPGLTKGQIIVIILIIIIFIVLQICFSIYNVN